MEFARKIGCFNIAFRTITSCGDQNNVVRMQTALLQYCFQNERKLRFQLI